MTGSRREADSAASSTSATGLEEAVASRTWVQIVSVSAGPKMIHQLLSFLDLVKCGYSSFQLYYFIGQASATDTARWQVKWSHGLSKEWRPEFHKLTLCGDQASIRRVWLILASIYSPCCIRQSRKLKSLSLCVVIIEVIMMVTYLYTKGVTIPQIHDLVQTFFEPWFVCNRCRDRS